MKKNNLSKRALTLLAALMLCIASMNTVLAAGYTDIGYVTQVWTQNADNYDTFAVQLSITHIDPDNCASGNQVTWYRIKSEGNAGYKTFVSTILAAAAAKKQVKLYLDGCVDVKPRPTNAFVYY